MTRLRPLDPDGALRNQIAVYIATRPGETKATLLCGVAKQVQKTVSFDVVRRVFEEVWSKR